MQDVLETQEEKELEPKPQGEQEEPQGTDWKAEARKWEDRAKENLKKAKASAGTNPHYNPKYEAYSSNCQRCVLTYEARRRGYDVTALPTYSGDLLPYGRDYLKGLSNPKTVNTGKSVMKIRKEMQSYGDGARAIVQVTKGREGHVFIAENKGGKIIYIDPQINSRYIKLSLREVSNSAITRIDNQDFTEYAKNAFTRQKV